MALRQNADGSWTWSSYGSPYVINYPGTTTTTTPTPTTSGPIVIATPSTVAPPDAISIVTGIDPNEVAAATYDKIIPIWVGGMPRLGCHIIYGPTFTTTGGITYASFGVSFGMPAVNIGVREIRELRLDGYKVWSLAEGYLMTGLTFRFYPGDELQAADPLVIAAYPAAPVAHRGHCTVFIENLALTDFNLKVPFVSAVIAETYAWTFNDDGAVSLDPVDPEDGVDLGYALEALAYSPYINLASATEYSYGYRATADFVTEGISERIDALIVAENVSFLDLINRFARLHLWDIVQRDKLMAIERGSVAPDISLDLTHILSSGDAPPILIERAPMSDSPRELEYSFVDIQRDYEINSVTSKLMSVPAPATRSEGKDTVALPVVHTTQEGMSWVTLRLFKDQLARETLNFTTSIVGYEIEPGDIVSVNAGFKTYIIRVIESMKGANWTNRIRGEPILRCAPPFLALGEAVGAAHGIGTMSAGGPAPLDGLNPTSALSVSRNLLSSYGGNYYTLVSGKVSHVDDQTGNGYHAQQTTSDALRPVINFAGANNRAALSFDGVDDFLIGSGQLTGLITASTGYIICSFVVDAITTNEANIFDNDAVWCDFGGFTGLHLKSGGTAHGYNWDSNADVTSHSIALGTTYVMEWKHAGGVLSSRINSGGWQTVASGNTGSMDDDIIFGAQINGSIGHAYTDVRIIEFITFNTTLTTAQENVLAADLYTWAEG